MSLHSRIVKGSIALTAGQVISYGTSFVRNWILARLLTKADMGIAATFAIAVSLFELVNRMGISGLVVQSKEGDRHAFLATAHLFQATAGFVSGALIFCFAGTLAVWFKIPDTVWAFRCLAFIPLLTGLCHLDVQCRVREMQYIPAIAIDVVPQIAITLLAWPLALIFRDFRVLLWVLLAKSALTFLGSHFFARRPFQLAWNSRYSQEIFNFGWPLLVNGTLLFGILQGDRFLVAVGYTPDDLGGYSQACQLSLVPGMMFVQVLASLMLPLLSRVQDNQEEFEQKYMLSVQSLCLFSAIFASTLIIAGEQLITLMYGPKYAGTGIVLGWLAIANAFRIIRAAPAIAASARADTKNHMMSNLFRITGIFFGIVVVCLHMPLAFLAATGLIGECIAFFVSMTRLSRRHHLPLSASLAPAAYTALFGMAAWTLVILGIHRASWLVAFSVALLMSVAAVIGMLLLFGCFRQMFLRECEAISVRYVPACHRLFGKRDGKSPSKG
jgi:O-antigen/teichoic acid export membrane protein